MRCANCGALLAGPFCHECGQEESRRLDSLGSFLRHGVSGLLHLDGITLRSVHDLLFRPGKLTANFLGGRRVRYVQPVQLYLLAAALFFLVNSYHPFLLVDVAHQEIRSSLGAMATGGTIDQAQLEALSARGISPALFAERFRTMAGSLLPLFLIGAVVLFAAGHRGVPAPLAEAAARGGDLRPALDGVLPAPDDRGARSGRAAGHTVPGELPPLGRGPGVPGGGAATRVSPGVDVDGAQGARAVPRCSTSSSRCGPPR